MGVLFETEVRERIRVKPYLEPVFSDSYDITRRVREIDPDLFICWNAKRKKYEVHSLGNKGSTYGLDVPNNRLDARVLRVIRRNNIRTRGKEIFRELDEAEERLEKSQESQRSNNLLGIAEDMHPYFSRVAWGGVPRNF